MTGPAEQAPARAGVQVTLAGREARTVSPEGAQASARLDELFPEVGRRLGAARSLVLPDGVKWLGPVHRGLLVVHQTPPRVHALKWILPDSPQETGPLARYRLVHVALPYVILLAVLREDPSGRLRKTDWIECFFRNTPLRCEDDALAYPALLNCGRPRTGTGKPLSWVCTIFLGDSAYAAEEQPSRRLHALLQALVGHVLESGFNRHMEAAGMQSWFSETVRAGIDRRLASIDAWERASREDPLFALQVPWLPTGHSLGEVIARARQAGEFAFPRLATADDVAALIRRDQLDKLAAAAPPPANPARTR